MRSLRNWLLLFAIAGLTPLAMQLPNQAAAGAQEAVEAPTAAETVIAYLDATEGPIVVAEVPRLDELGAPPWIAYLVDPDPATVRAWELLFDRLTFPLNPPAAPDERPPGDADGDEPPLTIAETEPIDATGENDTVATGQRLVGIGTTPSDDGSIRSTLGLTGQLAAADGAQDIDVYLVALASGDVISVGASGEAFRNEAEVRLVDPGGAVVMGSGINPRLLYPVDSPLRQLGDAAVDHVVVDEGTHAVVISGSPGAYAGQITVRRTGLRDDGADPANQIGADQQVIFLDFDGATTDPSLFNPFDASIDVELSPLSTFLTAWNLEAADEDAVIDRMVAVIGRAIDEDPRLSLLNGNRDESGVPGEFDVELRNSRDDADPWGEPNVSRIIIGGTADELGLPVVGVAESTDPGNLIHEETAVVLLDRLSRPPGPRPTLNNFAVAPGRSMADLVAEGVGRIAAHEAGHLLGNWHTDGANEIGSLSDAGGDLARFVGIGDDEIFGTADDDIFGFTEDVFAPLEGFTGLENPLNRVAQGLSTPAESGGGANPPPDPEPSPTPVPEPTQQTPFLAVELPGRVEAENYDEGGQGLAFNEVDAFDNRGGQYRQDPVDIWTTVGEPDGLTVGATRGGEWLEYTVDVVEPTTVTALVRMATAFDDPGAIAISIDGTAVGTASPGRFGTGGWWDWEIVKVGTVDLEPGRHVVRMTWLDAGQINVDWLAFVERTPAAAHVAPGRIEAELFDDGGQGVTYNDSDPQNVGGELRDTGVDIYRHAREPGGYVVGRTFGGEWVEYTFVVEQAGVHNIDARIASGDRRSGSISASIDGVRAGVARPNRTGWWDWSVERISQVDLSPGPHTLRITWNRRGAINLDWIEFSLAGPR